MEIECSTPTTKAARLVYLLSLGRRYTTVEIAELFGITRQGAWRLLVGLTWACPIRQDDQQRWFLELAHEAAQ